MALSALNAFGTGIPWPSAQALPSSQTGCLEGCPGRHSLWWGREQRKASVSETLSVRLWHSGSGYPGYRHPMLYWEGLCQPARHRCIPLKTMIREKPIESFFETLCSLHHPFIRSCTIGVGAGGGGGQIICFTATDKFFIKRAQEPITTRQKQSPHAIFLVIQGWQSPNPTLGGALDNIFPS